MTMTHANYDRVYATSDNETFLAVYTGPGGPISFTIEAVGIGHAKRIANKLGKEQYNAGSNALGVDADASNEDVEVALEKQGWRLALAGDHGDDWFIYQT